VVEVVALREGLAGGRDHQAGEVGVGVDGSDSPLQAVEEALHHVVGVVAEVEDEDAVVVLGARHPDVLLGWAAA
jgi:hypothetical protein